MIINFTFNLKLIKQIEYLNKFKKYARFTFPLST